MYGYNFFKKWVDEFEFVSEPIMKDRWQPKNMMLNIRILQNHKEPYMEIRIQAQNSLSSWIANK